LIILCAVMRSHEPGMEERCRVASGFRMDTWGVVQTRSTRVCTDDPWRDAEGGKCFDALQISAMQCRTWFFVKQV
jgi:hypothetical protein